MVRKNISKLHWKLFFPLIGLLWVIIGVTIFYFVSHEKYRQKENLENRLINVNNTVIAAYERGENLQNTVDFIRLFTNNTTLDPLRITVYDEQGNMVADNAQTTITLYDSNGKIRQELSGLWDSNGHATIQDMAYDDTESMINSQTSRDGHIHSFAALPYEGEVLDFLSFNPMVWIAIILLGVIMSAVIYLGIRAVCENVYSLQDFARSMAADQLPEDTDSWHFSKDELGDVSRSIVRLYHDKIKAEQEKRHHEHQISINVRHELNTPVSIIKGYLDTVLRNPDMPEETKLKFLYRAQQSADRLASLVNDVSMVIRLGEENADIPCDRLNLSEFASRIADDIEQGHVANNMTFEYDVPADCEVMAHESLLTNALLNLAYNSGQYSGGDKMSLRWIKEENGQHTLTFEDNGDGVGKEHLSRLFDLFYRVDTGRARKNGGSGLGLSLVKRIITAMGGNVSVENSDTSGLRFIISLPKAEATD